MGKKSAFRTRQFAKVVWDALVPMVSVLPVVRNVEDGIVADTARLSFVAENPLVEGRLNSVVIDPPRMPIWCSLITRSISLKSSEGRSQKAQEAISSERRGLDARSTWDYSSVRSYTDWVRDPEI